MSPEDFGWKLGRLNTDLSELAAGYEMSQKNRAKLFDACALIQEVMIDIVGGEDDHRKEREEELEQLHGERAALLSSKRYVLKFFDEPQEGYQHYVWVEHKDGRYQLPNPEIGEFSWGYTGTGPQELTRALLNDCFGDSLPKDEKRIAFEWVLKLVSGMPQENSGVLYEYQLKAYPK